ncbi:MAG: tRNA guanosine(34) transglycosylase Tgt [Candidatus Woesearchaeota archaeon]
MSFKIIAENGKARAGVLKTRTGEYETPFFMPVLTRATPKFLTVKDILDMGCRNVISNSFLLSLRPGIETAGDIHEFMDFPHCVFTDNGGFQMVRSTFYRGHDDKGIFLEDPDTKQKHHITPEKSCKIQESLKGDVAMALDNVPEHGKERDVYEESVRLTTLWHKRFLAAHQDDKQLVFGIAQGGTFEDLREQSAKELAEMPFDGFALGGLCIGEGSNKMAEMVQAQVKHFPSDKPRYLMGVGTPKDIILAVKEGVDIFDSAFPTIAARHGIIFSSEGEFNIKKVKNINDGPLDPKCDCWVCKKHTRKYISHLVRANEPTAHVLTGYHNLYYIVTLMKNIRIAIMHGEFNELVQKICQGKEARADTD